MNNKKFLLIPIILMLLMIIISSASAGELNTAEGLTINEELSIDNGDSINLDEENNIIVTDGNEDIGENIEQSDNSKEKDTLSDSNSITVTDKTFEGIQAAIDEANENDTIILDGVYEIYPNYSSANVAGSITVNKKLNFVGINNATLNYHKQESYWDDELHQNIYYYGDSVFKVNKDNVSFIGITFQNSHADVTNGGSGGRGSSIYSSAYLIVKNCSFINNYAGYYGGAIFASAGIDIDNCRFINVKATSDKAGALYLGSSLFNDYKQGINNCYFENCSSRLRGGAIGGGTSTGDTSYHFISGCIFKNCKSKYGGAISLQYDFLFVDNCSFINCSATNGGAIYQFAHNMTMNNSYFEDNSASDGGAIYGFSQVHMYNTNFTNNHASNYGGAIDLCFGEGEMANCLFNGNYAKSGGTLSFSSKDPRNVGAEFLMNAPDKYGFSDFNLTNCNFTNSVANGLSGGTISCIDVYNVIFDSCNFKNSFANSSDGGALSFKNASSINITNCNFTNSHSLNGGAISIDELSSEFNISNSKFIDNDAEYVGGAIYFLAENGTIFESTFKNNHCPDAGGAIFISESANLVSIYYSNFTENTVVTGYLGDNKFGGAICWLGKQGVIIKSNFNNNSCPDAGGAIFVNDDTSSINITECGFRGNSISSDYFGDIRGGGAICSISKSIIISVCSFISNFATQSYGGALYLNSGTNSLGSKNLLSSSMLFAEESSAIRRSEFRENDAFKANALYSVSSTEFLFNNITLRSDETLEDLFYGISLGDTNTFERIKGNSTVSASAVTSYYGKTFSVKVVSNNATSIKYSIKNSKGSVVKSGSINPGASITGLSFVPGTYTLYLTTVVDENHTSRSASSKITVNKATGNITASALTTYYGSGKTWSITLKDKTNSKVLASKKLNLKVYTGSKYKTYTVTTNSKGVATFKASTLAPGSHKVIVSYSNSNYTTKSLTKTLKINKMALSYKVSRSTQKDGAGLHIWVKNKATGKVINKVKIKVLVYTGKKYKTTTLVSGKYSSKGNGYVGYAVKGTVYSVGTHTVKIIAGDSYHSGSIQSTLVIKSTAKKYSKKIITISKGSRSVKNA